MFARSASAWNRGDLDTFMTDYLPGDRTTYVTSRGVVHGPAAIRERYAPRCRGGGRNTRRGAGWRLRRSSTGVRS